MWEQTLSWFLATNKTNYQAMSVDMAYMTHSMLPSLLELYRVTRCCFLCGNKGRGIGKDHACEFMNLYSRPRH